MTLERTLRKAIAAGKRVILENLDVSSDVTGETNAFGDSMLVLDTRAEEEIISVLNESSHSFAIMSEEIGTIMPEDRPEFIALIDPLDGSSNLKRGIPLCSVGIAVASYHERLTTNDIEMSMIESIFTDELYFARTGKGATRNGKNIRVSKVKDPEIAIISYDTKKSWSGEFGGGSYRTMIGVYDMRRTGSNLLDLCWTASGGLDAMVDLRDILPIIHASGTHIVQQAGGVVLDKSGNEWVVPLDFEQRMSFVAAGTYDLAQSIIEAFNGE